MSDDVERRVEEMLRVEAAGARRDPPRDLRARVEAAIESGSTAGRRAPVDPRAWRGRVQNVLVAASVLVAAGLWAFALFRLPPHGSAPITAATAAAPDSQAPDTSTIARLASATPRSLGSAIDGSLLGELENITQDALGAARFLAGRVPTPLVEGETSSPR